MKALVFAIDVMPGRGRRTSGGSLRTAQIARHFERLGHEVIVSQPRDAQLVRLQMRSFSDGELASLYHAGNQLEIIRAAQPDVVVWAWPLVSQVPVRLGSSITTVIDLNGFQNIEGSAFGGVGKLHTTRALLERASKADHVIFGSSEQKSYWTGIADLLEIPLRGRSWILPFYYQCAGNKAYDLGEPDFHYTGSLLPWLKTQSLLSALVREMEARRKGRLCLTTHIEAASPNYLAVESFLAELRGNRCAALDRPSGPEELFSRIGFRGIGFDLSGYSFEREFALPIRTICYLAHGIPVVVSDYSCLAGQIRRAGAGWALPTEPRSFADAIRCLMDELTPAETAVRSANAARFAKEAFGSDAGWDELISTVETQSPCHIGFSSSPSAPAVLRARGLNVLVVSDDFENIQKLRVHAPLRELQSRGVVANYVVFGKDGISHGQGLASNLQIDRVWVQRAPIVSISAILDLTGGRFNYDIDDNLLLSPSYRPPIPPAVRQGVRLLLATATNISVAMPGLVPGLTRHAGFDIVGRATVAPNLLIRGRGRREYASKPDKLLIGSSDFLALGAAGRNIFKAVATTARRHDLRVMYIGNAPDEIPRLLGKEAGRLLTHPVMPYGDYLEFLENSHAVGIAPLDVDLDPLSAEFVLGKSDIKAVEFLGMGLPAVFSDIGPYALSDIQIPLLASNTVDCWEDRLEQAMAMSDATRSELARQVEECRGLGSAALEGWSRALEQSSAPPPLGLSRWLTTFEKMGMLLGRQDVPEPFFDADFYLRTNSDVRARIEAGGITAWQHFVRHGRDEGRAASPFDSTVPVSESVNRLIGLTLQMDQEMNRVDAQIAVLSRSLSD